MMVERESKILLVEDSFEGMQYVGSILNDAGYKTVTSLNGNNSLIYIAKEKFDLIILDLVNSELAGYDVLAQIMERGRNAEAPVVFLTEGGENGNLMQGVRYPNVDFVRKPFKREELLARVGNQLAIVRSKEEARAVKSLRDSIKYAYRIQKSMLPSNDLMNEAFPSHFIFHKPLDVVSGDFYWAKKIDDMVVFAVADCSGHGVPGAFLSILGISLLNELSMKTKLDYPHVIMDNLRHRFKESLERSGIESYFSEGIDMVIGMIDRKDLKMYSAGAFNSIFHSRDGKIYEIKGDRQPVGYYPVEKPFTQRETQLKAGDQLFFNTDGIVDQMGGEKGKKLQSRGFSSWLKEMAGQPSTVQKQILNEKVNRWMGSYSQIDDILVMGIEI
jgi:serine phosphatase RsbU (regulator of sigma subunit)